jgi:hypothetical protein
MQNSKYFLNFTGDNLIDLFKTSIKFDVRHH